MSRQYSQGEWVGQLVPGISVYTPVSLFEVFYIPGNETLAGMAEALIHDEDRQWWQLLFEAVILDDREHVTHGPVLYPQPVADLNVRDLRVLHSSVGEDGPGQESPLILASAIHIKVKSSLIMRLTCETPSSRPREPGTF